MRRSLVHLNSTLSPFLTRTVSCAASTRPLAMATSNALLAGSAATPASGAAPSASRNSLLLMKKAGQRPASGAYNRSRGSVLGHFHPAAAELAARTVRASRGADDVEAVRLLRLALAVVLHADAERGRGAVEGPASVELHRVGGRQDVAARVAHAAEEVQARDLDRGLGGLLLEVDTTLDAAAIAPRIDMEVRLALAACGDQAVAFCFTAHALVVLGVRELENPQAALVPAGIDEARRRVVARVGTGKVVLAGLGGDHAWRLVVGDLLRILRVAPVDHADALVRAGEDHPAHVVAVVEADVVQHAAVDLLGHDAGDVVRVVHVGLERSHDARVLLVADVDQAAEGALPGVLGPLAVEPGGRLVGRDDVGLAVLVNHVLRGMRRGGRAVAVVGVDLLVAPGEEAHVLELGIRNARLDLGGIEDQQSVRAALVLRGNRVVVVAAERVVAAVER